MQSDSLAPWGSKTPETNKDLLLAIYDQGRLNGEQITALQGDMTHIKRQVEYTNGKVAGLIEDKIRREKSICRS